MPCSAGLDRSDHHRACPDEAWTGSGVNPDAAEAISFARDGIGCGVLVIPGQNEANDMMKLSLNAFFTASLLCLLSAPSIAAQSPLYREKYRPQFHFTARQWTTRKPHPSQREEGWMNDPNGLVYLDGEYHLFSQRWAECWIHAVSRDLVHWTELQPAFWKDLRFGDGVQSGGAVVDQDNTSSLSPDRRNPPMVAFWAGWDNRSQCICYSLDKGHSWKEYEKNPVLVHSERDPKVFWHAPTKRWIMLLSDQGVYRFFASTNLLEWSDLNFALADSFECPDMFQMPIDGDPRRQKWVVIRGNGKYSIGEFDGAKFTAETPQIQSDYGANFYATQSWGEIPGRAGRRIQIAWMSGGKYPGMPFNQQMTFPCDLKLRAFPEGLRLCKMPVQEIESLYTKSHFWKSRTIEPGGNLLAGISGELFDIELRAKPAAAGEFGITCRGESITYSPQKSTLACLGRQAPVRAPGGEVTLRILLDRTSIEVFANYGEAAMSSCFLPAEENKSLELFCHGGNLRIVSLSVRSLKSSWPETSAN
jgi:fructan beta-fructosidase